MEINSTDVYKETDFISRELRKAIKHMPRYNRYNGGDRIINISLDNSRMTPDITKGVLRP